MVWRRMELPPCPVNGFWNGQLMMVLIRLYDKDGLYMCTLCQEFTNMVHQVLDEEDYEGCLEQVED